MARAKLRPAHPDPTPEAPPQGEALPPLGKRCLLQDHTRNQSPRHPTLEEHHATSTPLQRGPGRGSQCPSSRWKSLS